MRNLKRFIFVALLAFATIGTTACGSSNKVAEKKDEYQLLKTMVLEQPTGLNVEISYYGTGDIAYKQTAKTVLPYKAVQGGTKEATEKVLTPAAEQYKNLKGVTHNLEYGEESVVETLEVNFKELDVEKAKGVPGLMLQGDPKNGVSVEKSTEMLKQNGFVEKK